VISLDFTVTGGVIGFDCIEDFCEMCHVGWFASGEAVPSPEEWEMNDSACWLLWMGCTEAKYYTG